MAIYKGGDALNPQKKNKQEFSTKPGSVNIVDMEGYHLPDDLQKEVWESSTYQYRDIEKRREYMRDLMRERRKKEV